MDSDKIEIMCKLNEIGNMVCNIKDKKKLSHCDKKVKELYSYLKSGKSGKSRKSLFKSKTMRKSKNTMFNTPNFLSNIDKSPISPSKSMGFPGISGQPSKPISSPGIFGQSSKSMSSPGMSVKAPMDLLKQSKSSDITPEKSVQLTPQSNNVFGSPLMDDSLKQGNFNTGDNSLTRELESTYSEASEPSFTSNMTPLKLDN